MQGTGAACEGTRHVHQHDRAIIVRRGGAIVPWRGHNKDICVLYCTDCPPCSVLALKHLRIFTLQFPRKIASVWHLSGMLTHALIGDSGMAHNTRNLVLGLAAVALGLAGFGTGWVGPSVAQAAIDPNSGVDFVTIGAVGNAPYRTANPNYSVNNRGGVGYVYNIGKFEVTTAQWVEFFNAAYDRPANDRLLHLYIPNYWGAASTAPNTPGGLRWTVPAGNEMRPVGGISWRIAAMYCNWLCNGKSTDRAAFMNGAYDVSTFGFTPGGTWTDQAAHNPGARYWIPTLDEWLKAAHYDPNKPNPDGTTGGWWQYGNSSDAPFTYGLPPLMGGNGTANSGYWNPSPFSVPLGSYTGVQSPWGLYDVAGGTAEWTESIRTLLSGTKIRYVDGSFWSEDATSADINDQLLSVADDFPHIPTYEYGLRIASSIPSPGSLTLVVGALCIVRQRRKK